MDIIVKYKKHKRTIDTCNDLYYSYDGIEKLFNNLISWFASIDGVDEKDRTIEYKDISIELGE